MSCYSCVDFFSKIKSLLQINSKSLDKVKTLSEAIDLVLNSPNQISLLLERDSVKPLPAARTPKLAKKPVVVPEPEPVIAAQAAIEVHSEPPRKCHYIIFMCILIFASPH